DEDDRVRLGAVPDARGLGGVAELREQIGHLGAADLFERGLVVELRAQRRERRGRRAASDREVQQDRDRAVLADSRDERGLELELQARDLDRALAELDLQRSLLEGHGLQRLFATDADALSFRAGKALLGHVELDLVRGVEDAITEEPTLLDDGPA